MRITSEVMVTRSLDRLQNRLKAYERSQSQLASGQRIMKPSDDPAGTRRSMSLTAAMRAREQELANAEDGKGWLDSADTQLQTMLSRLAQIREVAVEGASEKEPTSRDALAAEVRSIRDEMVAIVNDRRLERPLFGGFTDGDAVEFDGTSWSANGTGDEVTRRVSDTELVRVNITAGEVLGFQANGTTDGTDALTMLEDLAVAIETGDQDQVTGMIGDVTVASDRVAEGLAAIGSAANRVQGAAERARDVQLTLRNELSNVRDTDFAEGIMELQVQQVAYEATLQALAKALPPSLGSFLR